MSDLPHCTNCDTLRERARIAEREETRLTAELARLREALEKANQAFLSGDPDEAYAAVRTVIGRSVPPPSLKGDR